MPPPRGDHVSCVGNTILVLLPDLFQYLPRTLRLLPCLNMAAVATAQGLPSLHLRATSVVPFRSQPVRLGACRQGFRDKYGV